MLPHLLQQTPTRTTLLKQPLIALIVLGVHCALAEVQLASPFTSHMVLQREMQVPVWGTAAPGESVTVEFAGQKKTALTASGKWRVELDPLPAAAQGRPLTTTGSATAQPIVLDDVLVGEVWLASGQSNMDFPMSKKRAYFAGVINEAQEIAAANFPRIRVFTAKAVRTNVPQESVAGEWLVCSPETVPGFSAVGYFFARDLHQELKVPVGIVTLAFGASCAQAWIRREAIAADSVLNKELDRFDEQVKNYVPPSAEEVAKWQEAAAKARTEGRRAPRQPRPHPASDQHNPTTMYNGIVAPVVPYAIRGVIWYQGESITAPKELFPRWNETLIKDWRKLWNRELPFYVCQLAALENNSNNPQVREWQAEVLKLPATGLAVTIDVGDRNDVHPHDKAPVGNRLARLALAQVYGRKIEFSGPHYESFQTEGDAVRLKFSRLGGGLVAKAGPLKTFEVAGADGKFVSAEATIEGETIVVRSAAVPAPVVVRYAWANYPDGCNLYNAAGLPAAPFRTDQPDR
jgi:sialate O-acetylesterase